MRKKRKNAPVDYVPLTEYEKDWVDGVKDDLIYARVTLPKKIAEVFGQTHSITAVAKARVYNKASQVNSTSFRKVRHS